jgi:hypothetical protein
MLVECPALFVSIFGTPSGGKSYFLASMCHRLRQVLPREFRVNFSDADPAANASLHHYEDALFGGSEGGWASLPKTDVTGDRYSIVDFGNGPVRYPRPFFFQVSPAAGHPLFDSTATASRAICLYDNFFKSKLHYTMKNKLKIDQIKTSMLIPYARNSRTHSEAQVAQIAGSIREFGFTNPVLIDAENGIIAGHGRIMAAQKLGLEDVPCIRLDHLTDTQRKAYIIADNKLALNSGWDEEMLGLELADLRELDFDLNLTGFYGDEIEKFLNPPEQSEPPSDFTDVDENIETEQITYVCEVLNEQIKNNA